MNQFIQRRLPAIIVATITFCVYISVFSNGFINLDDLTYVVENKHIADGISVNNIIWAFTTLYDGNWFPLTWITHMVDIQFFGLDPQWHHLGNVVLHTASTVLLFLVLRRMTRAMWPSIGVALLFALHPLHVESVAWVSERKDVLSAFFWMLTIWLYISYAEKRTVFRYTLVMLSFLLGLMSKTMVVTLPVVLLLLDYWPMARFASASGIMGTMPDGRRSWQLLLGEKLPLFGMSVIVAAATFYAQRTVGGMPPFRYGSLLFNIENSLIAYTGYLKNMIWPTDLSVFYPINPEVVTIGNTLYSFIFLVTISLLCVWARRRHPYLLIGWLWYVITLLPVIGIVHFGPQAMADRYTYIPLIGPFIAISWGAFEFIKIYPTTRKTLAAVSIVVLLALSVATIVQILYWHDSITLFERAIEVTENNWKARLSLGRAYEERNQYEEALMQYGEALRIDPFLSNGAYTDMGRIYLKTGDIDKAISSLKNGLWVNATSIEAHYMLGAAYQRIGEIDLALEECRALNELNIDAARELFALINGKGTSDTSGYNNQGKAE